MGIIGIILSLSGIVCVAIGVFMLGVAALNLVRPDPKKHSFTANITVADATDLIKALSSAPQWLAAILVGDIQIWIGLFLLQNGKLPFTS
jgi:hypothetical protein